MHTQVLGIAAAAGTTLALLPSTAAAREVRVVRVPALASRAFDQSSAPTADLAALNAYSKYLMALGNDEASSTNRASTIVTGVESGCANADSDLSNLNAGQVQKKALQAFGDEVDADLDLAYMAPTKPALNKLAGSLAAISWPSSTQAKITSRLISTERAMLGVGQSNICTDAEYLDNAPLSEATPTANFLRRYRGASRNLSSALGAFQGLLAQFETDSESKLIAQINTMVSNFSAQSASTEETDAATVLSELGISVTSAS